MTCSSDTDAKRASPTGNDYGACPHDAQGRNRHTLRSWSGFWHPGQHESFIQRFAAAAAKPVQSVLHKEWERVLNRPKGANRRKINKIPYSTP